MPNSYRWISRLAARVASRSRLLARAEEGFGLIEVLVSAVMVILIAGAALAGIDATTRTTADQRARAQADEVAQQDQERLGGMSAAQLSDLNQTRTVTLGQNFTVTSTAQFLTHGSSTPSCSSSGSGSADFFTVVSAVTWGNNRPAGLVGTPSNPLKEESVITPPIGGSLLTRVVDQNNAPLSGVTVTASGADSDSGVTDSSGCTIFGGMNLGDFTVTASESGFVDFDGDTSPSSPATTTANGTTTVPFKLGKAGLISAFFSTRVGGTLYTSPTATSPITPAGQRAPALSWFNPLMSSSQNSIVSPSGSPAVTTPAAQINSNLSPISLFPFTSGANNVYTNNYTVWAGKCDLDKPPSANLTFATVGPGGWAILQSPGVPAVLEPALIITVTNKVSSTSTIRIKPAHITLKDACGQTWNPSIRGDSDTNTTFGALDYPGQPYGATSTSYTVCADYRATSTSPYYKKTVSTSNANFTTGTAVPVPIDSTSTVNQGTC
jgi:Tfp pilus assembly protein PilV